MAKRAQGEQRQLEGLLRELQGLGFCLPGTISERKLCCGNPGCACRQDPAKRHGPYAYWTRTVRGRTVAQLLSAEQRERYLPWIENHRRLRTLVKQIEALSIASAQRAEGWSEKPRTSEKLRTRTQRER